MKLSEYKMKRSEKLLMLVTLLVVAFVSHKYLYNKVSNELDSLSTTEKTIKNKIVQIDNKLSAVNQKRNQASLSDVKLSNKVVDYLSLNSNFSNILKRISISEKTAPIEVKDIKVVDTIIADNMKETILELEVQSSFIDLGKFLESLEKSNYLLNVKNLEVLKMEEDLRDCRSKIQLHSFTLLNGSI